MDIVEKARIFATAAHAAVSHKRKYTFEDYIIHPAEVAATVATVPNLPYNNSIATKRNLRCEM